MAPTRLFSSFLRINRSSLISGLLNFTKNEFQSNRSEPPVEESIWRKVGMEITYQLFSVWILSLLRLLEDKVFNAIWCGSLCDIIVRDFFFCIPLTTWTTTFLRNEKRSKSSKRPSADGRSKTSAAPSTDSKKSSGSSSKRKEDSLPYDDGDRREMDRNSQQGSTAQLSRLDFLETDLLNHHTYHRTACLSTFNKSEMCIFSLSWQPFFPPAILNLNIDGQKQLKHRGIREE